MLDTPVLAEHIVTRVNEYVLLMNNAPLSLQEPPAPTPWTGFYAHKDRVICRARLNEHDVVQRFIESVSVNPTGIYWICNSLNEPVAYLTHDDVLVYRPNTLDHVALIRRMLDAGITLKGLALIGA